MADKDKILIAISLVDNLIACSNKLDSEKNKEVEKQMMNLIEELQKNIEDMKNA